MLCPMLCLRRLLASTRRTPMLRHAACSVKPPLLLANQSPPSNRVHLRTARRIEGAPYNPKMWWLSRVARHKVLWVRRRRCTRDDHIAQVLETTEPRPRLNVRRPQFAPRAVQCLSTGCRGRRLLQGRAFVFGERFNRFEVLLGVDHGHLTKAHQLRRQDVSIARHDDERFVA